MLTLLYLKCITNKDLLYSTENFAQYYVAGWVGRKFGGDQADERARVARLSWRVRQMIGQVSRGLAGDYQSAERADERAGVARLSWRVSG